MKINCPFWIGDGCVLEEVKDEGRDWKIQNGMGNDFIKQCGSKGGYIDYKDPYPDPMEFL